MPDARPPHFKPGVAIGDHFTIEGLVRLAEGRMYYLANDVRSDRPERKCWTCGHENTLRSHPKCDHCKTPFEDRRFLISARWDNRHFAAYQSYYQKGLSHPGLAFPCYVGIHEGRLISATPYLGEGLMVDEASPFSNQRVLDIAQRVAGTLAYLHINGIQLLELGRKHLLIAPDESVRLFDLDVAEVGDQPVPPALRGREIGDLVELVRRYCHVQSQELIDLLLKIPEQPAPTTVSFGRAIERAFDGLAAKHYRVATSALTDVGLTRQLNEDNWGWRKLSDRANLFVVADGMGGHDGGEVASQLAVDTMCAFAFQAEAASPDIDQLNDLVEKAFQTANNTIKDHADKKGNDMGTTMVNLLLINNRLGFFANVGDSRGYMMRDKVLKQVTRDHSLVDKMVETGRITAEEARNHPHSNILLRTVGTERDIDIDIFQVDFQPGDKVLLCSDGLWGEVEDRDMESILNTYDDLRTVARELIRAAHHGGGKDNVTLMLVQIPE